MFVLKKEYHELDMNKLEVGVNAYMDEQNKKGGEIEVPPQATANLKDLMWILQQRLFKILLKKLSF